jgi:signal-transduction protein with cAMP-binding, CBS, and nucleotidyltransferase domain
MRSKLIKCFIDSFEMIEVGPRKLVKSGGEPPGYLFFIEKGTISVYRESECGKRIITAFMKEKDFIFDDRNLLTQKISDDYIISNEPLILYRIHFSTLKHIIATCGEFNYYLFALTCTNCQELRKRCDILAAPGTDRYARFKDVYGDIRFRVPINYLCSYLAITEPTLAKAAKLFGR